MIDVRLIAAVGRRGQIGLAGRLPWHEPEDLAWFKAQTLGGAVVMGFRTAHAVGALPGRVVVPWLGDDPQAIIDRIAREHPGRIVWIAGGAKTYAHFMSYVRRAVITLVDYDGPADVWMPPLWEGAQCWEDAR
ncbi:Dihydrofolate reductase [Chelatococcus sambhunathii]|uniref:dihydrofolate reductase n=1 Tax=Chelatococcus sambhunathii TaxID=363953 RepID=A0ABM9UEE5_9HYPH|nr:dihydrofolate reductase [Chelatococcus sambhunathii]CUA90154.1 Dihydrofolate reductase [Chelatococcus sambhunathii]